MSIIIDKHNTPLFIAIAKQGVHSFLMLGICNKKNEVSHLLCRVGKGFPKKDKNASQKSKTAAWIDYFNDACLGLFSYMPSRLVDEKTSRKNAGYTPISYQAYTITYKQYIRFIQIVESENSATNKIKCYKPDAEDERYVRLKLTSKPYCIPATYQRFNLKELHINNTCRHSALEMLEEIQVKPSALVSSYFFVDLPYKAEMEFGKPSSSIPFYVLPLPPAAFPDISNLKLRILEKLYVRMERLILLDPNSDITKAKFTKLKELYTELLGPQQETDIEHLITSIQQWTVHYGATVNAMRATYFWDSFFKRTSATAKMFNSIEQDLKDAALSLKSGYKS